MKTVLFYSFKGGVGRTQSLLNIAKYLAREKHQKIAIVDFDIYAPGLSYLSPNLKKDIEKEYFLKYLVNLFEDIDTNIYAEEIEANIDLIPVYNMENLRPYHELLTELSQYLYSIKMESDKRVDEVSTVTDNIFEVIKTDIAKNNDYDYIFFDARTGITEVSDILFSHYVDMKVFISSYNKQNIYGTNEILKMLSEQSISRHKVLRVLSPKPNINDSELEGIFAEADLVREESLLKLRKVFDWRGTMEIPYENEIVINDFNVWDTIGDENNYKKSIKDIANTIHNEFNEESILDELQNLH